MTQKVVAYQQSHSLLFNSDICISVAHPDSLMMLHEQCRCGWLALYLKFRVLLYLRSFLSKKMITSIFPKEWSPSHTRWKCGQYWFSTECVEVWLNSANEVGQLRMDAPYCHRDFKNQHLSVHWWGNTTNNYQRNGQFGFEQPHFVGCCGWWKCLSLGFSYLHFSLVLVWHISHQLGMELANEKCLIQWFLGLLIFIQKHSLSLPHSSVDCDEFLFYCRVILHRERA